MVIIINDIRRVRSSCCITDDNGNEYWLRQDDLYDSGFCTGQEYDQDEFIKRIRLYQYPRALNHAVAMLARRPCSRKEIRSRLIRLRYTEDTADLVIYRLEKEKLVDDELFCEQWIRFRLGRRYGPSVIRYELKMKGIPDDVISSAFSLIEPDDEQDNAFQLAVKALKRTDQNDDIRKKRRKVIASLVRKGYDWETAQAAFEKAVKENK